MSYGVWNSLTHRFCFGISESTRDAARMEFYKQVPFELKRRYRYEVKPIPKGWINPPNPLWGMKKGKYE